STMSAFVMSRLRRLLRRSAKPFQPRIAHPTKTLARSGYQRRLGALGDRAERGRVAGGDVREHLAVHLDAGLLQPLDEAAVRQVEGAHRGVDAYDPQRAELALLHLAITVGVDEPALDRFARLPIELAPSADVALGELENLLVAFAGLGAALYPW